MTKILKPLTEQQLQVLDLVYRSYRGHVDVEEIAFMMRTSHQAAGRMLSAICNHGFIYSARSFRYKKYEYWMTEKGNEYMREKKGRD